MGRNVPQKLIYCHTHTHTAMQNIAQEVKLQIEDFKPHIPLIQGLRNPGMRHRHWEQLSEELGFPLFPKADLTFKKCLDMNLQKHVEKIAKVAEVAGKEYAIEAVCLFLYNDRQ